MTSVANAVQETSIDLAAWGTVQKRPKAYPRHLCNERRVARQHPQSEIEENKEIFLCLEVIFHRVWSSFSCKLSKFRYFASHLCPFFDAYNLVPRVLSPLRESSKQKGPWEQGFDAYSFFLKMICIILSSNINYFLHWFELFSMFKIFFLFSHSSTDVFQLRL